MEASRETREVYINWWEEEEGAMASSTEGKQRFSGKKGSGLTLKQFELMVKGSLGDRFKKLQKDVGNPTEGAEFKTKYCVYLGEFMDNPAKKAHEREYEVWSADEDPVKAMFTSLKRHFEDHKEGKAQEWMGFKREAGEELPALLFRLQELAFDLEKRLDDQELATKFVTSLERRLSEQTHMQAMAHTRKPGGPYTLEEAYNASLRVQAASAKMRIARDLQPKPAAAEVSRARWVGRVAPAHAALEEMPPQVAAAGPEAEPGGSGGCHNCGEQGHYRTNCPHARRNSSSQGPQRGGPGPAGRQAGCAGNSPTWRHGVPSARDLQCPWQQRLQPPLRLTWQSSTRSRSRGQCTRQRRR